MSGKLVCDVCDKVVTGNDYTKESDGTVMCGKCNAEMNGNLNRAEHGA
jgi:hypothetical protein